SALLTTPRSPVEAVAAASFVSPVIQVFVRGGGAIPGVVLFHGALAHGLNVRGAVEPGGDGPADGVGQRFRGQVGEHEAGPAAGPFVVVLDGVDQPARGAHHGE